MTHSDIWKLIISVGICFSVAFVSSRFEPGTWYAALSRPGWTPPNWIFAPVWTILYAMMGVAAWLVWRKAGLAGAGLPLTVFAVQLILNGLWSYLFFGRHQIGLAFGEIIILWLCILLTLYLFWNVRQLAGILMIPYLLWVGFATVLNYAFWRLNS